MARAREEGYKIIYLDELCTTKSTIPTHDWTPRNQPFQVDYKQYHQRTVATIAAVSKEKGVELVMNFERSVNVPKFIEFLRALRQQQPFAKVALFMDQLAVHKSKDVREQYSRLKFEAIFNAAYSPNFNPIEGVIGVAKREIKKERLRALALNSAIDLEAVIARSFHEIEQK